ncbi:MAG: DUF255 domain-containing protein [Campylobacterota bacterium]|nr:DUF255 domain-containing protein [Campylobacterota bacterium]
MLKKIILTILLLATSLLANEINWAKDFKKGIKDSIAKDKPVLFISSRHSCKYCVILDEGTLKDKRVVEELNKDFISIISYSDENDYMPRELWSPGTPAIWFLLPNGKPMFQPIAGAIDADSFLNALQIVKTEFDKLKKQTTIK